MQYDLGGRRPGHALGLTIITMACWTGPRQFHPPTVLWPKGCPADAHPPPSGAPLPLPSVPMHHHPLGPLQMRRAWELGATNDAWWQSEDTAHTAWDRAIQESGLGWKYRQVLDGEWNVMENMVSPRGVGGQAGSGGAGGRADRQAGRQAGGLHDRAGSTPQQNACAREQQWTALGRGTRGRVCDC